MGVVIGLVKTVFSGYIVKGRFMTVVWLAWLRYVWVMDESFMGDLGMFLWTWVWTWLSDVVKGRVYRRGLGTKCVEFVGVVICGGVCFDREQQISGGFF